MHTYMLLKLSNLHSAVLILSTKECVSSGLTNDSVFIFGLFGQSFHVTFFSKNIDQRSRKQNLIWVDSASKASLP